MRYYINERVTSGKLKRGDLFNAFNKINEVAEDNETSHETFATKEQCIMDYMETLFTYAEYNQGYKWCRDNPLTFLVRGLCRYVESEKYPKTEGFDWYMAIADQMNSSLQFSRDVFCVENGEVSLEEAYLKEKNNWVVWDLGHIRNVVFKMSTSLFLMPRSGKVMDILYCAKLLSAMSRLVLNGYAHDGIDVLPMYQILANFNKCVSDEKVVSKLKRYKVKNEELGINISMYEYIKEFVWRPVESAYGVDFCNTFDIDNFIELYGKWSEMRVNALPVPKKGIKSSIWMGIESVVLSEEGVEEK